MYIPKLQCEDGVVTLSDGVMVSQITLSKTNPTVVSPTGISTDDSNAAAAKSTGENSTLPACEYTT